MTISFFLKNHLSNQFMSELIIDIYFCTPQALIFVNRLNKINQLLRFLQKKNLLTTVVIESPIAGDSTCAFFFSL